MFNLQNLIFEKNLSRIDLCNYTNNNNNKYKIFIYRNHSFELIEHTIDLYFDYAGFKGDFKYSDYDDSLSFLDLDLSSDLVILWLDISRYKTAGINDFISERLKYLSSIFNKQILFIPFESNLNINTLNITTYDLSKIKKQLGDKYLDERLEPFSGTKLSSKASLLISKDLGLNYIPACLKTPIKAVIFDLDNTLYKGVLGEDGHKNIELTNAHKKLQEKVVQLSRAGFFICIASKNEKSDVVEMFKQRNDFPLTEKFITKMCVSWNSKAEAISEIKKFLNIGVSDMLFVDDNIGEIASVKSIYPDINTILAKDDANITLNILNNYPRMLKLNTNYEDKIRQKDTQANEQREQLKNSLSKEDFLKNLKIELTYSLDKNSQIERISELANKTNQFICSYKRYSQKDVKYLMAEENSLVISVSLKDKLSDSGIIGVLVFKNQKDYLEIEECFISCRALGRGIDDSIVLYPIQLAKEKYNKNNIKINFTDGERNTPAKLFIDNNLSDFKNKIGTFEKKVQMDLVTTNIERL